MRVARASETVNCYFWGIEVALEDWEEFDVKTVVENYEDLAREIESIAGAKDNHFETIMGFIQEYKELKGFN